MENTNSEEEIHSFYWGLDPLFSTAVKLFVKDILELKQSRQAPGFYFYKTHPVYSVDIMGIVVQKKEKEEFSFYGVDDGTGVITCLCWKVADPAESSLSGPVRSDPDESRYPNLFKKLKHLNELDEKATMLEIGDVIRVRGDVEEFRGQREIKSSCYFKVDDPVWAVQISWMLELIHLYRNVYDQPFKLSEHLKERAHALKSEGMVTFPVLVAALADKIRQFVLENHVQTFSVKDLETVKSLVCFANRPVQSPSPAEATSKVVSTSKQVRGAFNEAIQLLMNAGSIFQKKSSSEDYVVTSENKELRTLTLDTVREDCRKWRHAEKGCSFSYILKCIQHSYNPCVTKAVMQQVLYHLEDDSDIYSTMDGHYMAF
ncbi:CST complex subunit STN1 isoform X1 [Latimeria chalumnae]|uniref:CST complex subunit STN1 isoform X1 n=2 Tax=Latimeria chalumnae TaxID=7897 RepID=UPI00313AD2E0